MKMKTKPSVSKVQDDPQDPDKFMEDYEKHTELGLGNFPLQGVVTFQKLDAQSKPIKYTVQDIARIVSS